MADTLFFKRSQTMYPYHVNYPPTVPTYPASQTMFSREVPEKYTKLKGHHGRDSHQNWTDKWADWQRPTRHQEELPKLADRREPCSRPWQYRPGTSAIPKWTKEGKDWPSDYDRFLRMGRPQSETVRARAINRLGFRDENLYPYTNMMTSNYRRPVYSVYGPMLRKEVYGLAHQHNQHGFMPSEDYY